MVMNGAEVLAFTRRLADQATQAAERLKFQTEHTYNSEKETSSTVTKEGTINSVTDGETTVSLVSVAHREDNAVPVWKKMKQWFKDKELIELWLVDTKAQKAGKFDADYFQGYITSFEMSAPSDDKVEVSMEIAVNGQGVEGQTTLTAEQYTVAQKLYEFETLQAKSKG